MNTTETGAPRVTESLEVAAHPVAPLVGIPAKAMSAVQAPHTTGRTVQAVFWKDWCSEWRTRAALNSIGLFAIASPIALSFNVARQKLEPETLAGLLWTVLLFAALVGLSRSFVKEEENGTAALLRLSCTPDAVLWGKALFNLVLLVATQLAAVPIFVLLLDARVRNVGQLLLVLLLGDLGLAVISALLGAIASQARARGALFAAIAVPVLLPLLVAASAGTAAAFGAVGPQQNFWAALQIIAGYDAAVIAAAWMLFEFVWLA